MTTKRYVLAFLAAPAGSVLVFAALFLYSAATDPVSFPLHDLWLLVVAVAVSYVAGLLLLPLLWLYKRLGEDNWKSYVSTAGVAGLIVAPGLQYPRPIQFVP